MNVVSVSSGVASAYTWHVAAEQHGIENTVGIFADVNGEHPDNYRFLAEIQYALDGRLVKLTNDGKNIWDVMCEGRFLANSRVDVCSRVLKRETCLTWLRANHTPELVMCLGFDWTEAHRFLGTTTKKGAKQRWAEEGIATTAPMIDHTLDKTHALAWLSDLGIEPPLLTRLGFPHANCGGGCVKSGAKWFKHLLRVLPDWYDWWERGEERVRRHLDADVAILRDRRGGQVRPLTLRELRETVSGQPALFDEDDRAGCGCFTFDDEDEAA